MSLQSFEVPPLRRDTILGMANEVRRQLRISEDSFPIIEILELVMPRLYGDEYCFGVKDTTEMGANHGLTVPSEKAIYLRDDVYERAIAGQGRDRFTACHELGHFLLHLKVPIKFHRSTAPLKAYVDSEWQANTFAGGLMMPDEKLVTCRSLDEVCERFGVSRKAASYQSKKLGILN